MTSISWLAGVVLLAGLVAWHFISQRLKVVHVPLVAAPGGDGPQPSLIEILEQGYQRYTLKNEIFKLQAPHGEQLVIPPRMLDEIKNLPTSKISFAQSLKDVSVSRTRLWIVG
jgi:hypothetical protein